MRRIYICITVFLVILFLFNINAQGSIGQAYMIDRDEMYYRAFLDSGCIPAGCSVSGWTIVENCKHITIHEMESMAREAAYFFGICDDFNFGIDRQLDRIDIKIDGKDHKDGNLKLLFSAPLYNDDIIKDSIYINIHIDYQHGITEANSIKGNITQYFSCLKTAPHVFVTLTGKFPDKLNYYKKRRIINQIFDVMDAYRVEGMSGYGIISKCGYSPYIDEGLITKNGRVNLNVALRYSEYDNSTYIWLGTPIIGIEY
ncbi:YwmB family TATA-box binding protein [Xylanivirga thermophila]|jgi:hypothetical protein|uniref:YwmB family TATA-box binding protein n=1 Tax=Xylanivirga thermophila TaxID=2496273 RepID=UPI00101D751F|nr:YwmB family TATA-box binding protein [Xylanivirga thermophila]